YSSTRIRNAAANRERCRLPNQESALRLAPRRNLSDWWRYWERLHQREPELDERLRRQQLHGELHARQPNESAAYREHHETGGRCRHHHHDCYRLSFGG